MSLCLFQDGRVMMLEPAGEEDEADLLRQDDEVNQSGRPLNSSLSSYSYHLVHFV